VKRFRKIGRVKKVLIAIAVIFALTSCAATNSLEIEHLNFRKIGRIPVVEGKINGKKAYFIIDTGASVSILNDVAADHFGFRSIAVRNQSVLGLGGQAKLNDAVHAVVEFGPLRLNGITFRTKHMADFVAMIKEIENIEIAGIIGGDVFDRYNITIDFKKCRILF
jgi:hypothetical protein